MKTLADVAVAAHLTETEALVAPAVLTSFFAEAGYTKQHMIDELASNFKLRAYFTQVCRTVAASPEAREIAKEYRQA